MARRRHRRSRRRSRSLGDLGAYPTVLGLSFPLAAVLGFVGYKVWKGWRPSFSPLALRPATPTQTVAAERMAEASLHPLGPFAPAVSPGAAVPGGLTPSGRSADIRARIKLGLPVNTVVGQV